MKNASSSNRSVVIIGATGSVGCYTALILKQHGWMVHAVGRRPSDNGFFARHGITYTSADICRKESFDSLPRSADAVIHLAGAMPARMKGYTPHDYISSILGGTLNVLEYMNAIGCKKIVFSHSIADILYKFGTLNPIPADSEMRFPANSDHSVYSICKNAAVNLIEHYHERYGISRFILRLPTIYVYQPSPFYYVDGIKRWIGYRYIIEQARKGAPLEIWGNPESTKEVVYIKDLVQLIEKCLEADCSGGIYNAGMGEPLSIREQITTIAEVFAPPSGQSPISYCPEKPSSPQFVLDISKAQKELGYHPQYNFRKWLVEFKRDMETNPCRELWGDPEDTL